MAQNNSQEWLQSPTFGPQVARKEMQDVTVWGVVAQWSELALDNCCGAKMRQSLEELMFK